MKTFETLTIQKQIQRQLDQINYIVSLAICDIDKIHVFKTNNPGSVMILPEQINDTVYRILNASRDSLILLINRIKIDLNGKQSIQDQLKNNAVEFFSKVDDSTDTNSILQVVSVWLDKIVLAIKDIENTKKEAWSAEVDAVEQLWTLIRVI